MLSLKLIRENTDLVRDSLAKRYETAPIDEILELDRQRRSLLSEVESLRAQRNHASQQIARLRVKPPDLISEMRQVGQRIRELENLVTNTEAQLNDQLLYVPNIVHPSVPVGKEESENVEVRRWGEPRAFDFEPLSHWEVGERLGVLDFARGSKISGPRSWALSGAAARLNRALISFMLDLHTQSHGYTEVLTPCLVRRECMVGTGQLPKFEEDAYQVPADDLFLIPTSEVSVANLHREEILPPDSLPINYVAYSACFRREAGAAGRDSRGLIRVHQFDKVEMVKLVEPDTSYDELERLVADAEAVLQAIELPYRVMLVCSGDVGFTATKKYDPEAWFPAQGRYREISSCSNCEDFQARRAGIRYRPAVGARPEYVHTLNGSGLAVGRTLAAILENYQQADGSVVVPTALRNYMGGLAVIS